MRPSLEPFVGRVREREELWEALEEALGGRGKLVMLVGEAGIGKTRLAEELSSEAPARGASVLWGRCWQRGASPTYWPWIEIIRGCLRQDKPEKLASWFGPYAEDLERIVPEVGQYVPRRFRRALLPSDPEQERFRVFDSARAFLTAVAASQPLVLVLDDLHTADRPSLILLRFVARGLNNARILIVGTYRDGEESSEAAELLGDLTRESHHIQLTGLSQGEVKQLIEKSTGHAPDDRTLATVYRETGGNPFFVNALVRMGGRALEQLVEDRARVPIPVSLRTAIARQLAPLSAQARHVLGPAAVIGPQFDFEILQQVSHLRAEDVLESLAEAEKFGLVSECSDSVGRYRFHHALIREALYAEIPSRARVHLHVEIAEALQKNLHPAAARGCLSELAYHFFQGAALGYGQKALKYAHRAAEEATAALAFEEAVRCYKMALAAMELGNSHDESGRCELLLALGQAQEWSGNHRASQATFSAAAELAQKLDDPVRLARAAIGHAGLPTSVPGIANDSSIRLLEQALNALDNRDSRIRAVISARLAVELYYRPGAGVRRHALAEQAVEISRRIGDSHTLFIVLGYRDMALSGPDTIKERLAGADEILRIAKEAGSQLGIYLACLSRLICFSLLGERHRADAEAETMLQVAKITGHPFCKWGCDCHSAASALAVGRFEEGEQLARQCQAFLDRMGRAEASDLFWPAMIMPLHEQGRLREVEPLVVKTVEQLPGVAVYHALLAQIHLKLGEIDKARSEFERVAVNVFADLPRDNTFLVCGAALAEVCAELRDTSRAEQLYGYLLPYASLNAVLGPLAIFGSVSRYLGLLAAATSRFDDAQQHFERALLFNQRIDAKPWLAYTQRDYAAMLLGRGAPGDRRSAVELLRSALEIAGSLGMKRFAEQAAALKLDAEAGAKHREAAAEPRTQKLAEPQGSSGPGFAPSRPAQPVLVPTGDAKVVQLRGRLPAPEPRPSNESAGSSFHDASNSPYEEAIFCREGDYWTIAYRGESFRLRHTKGLSCIAHLLQHPAAEIHASRLATLMDADPSAGLPDANGTLISGDAGPLLDAQAKAAYKHRLSELRQELEEAQASGNSVRAAKAEEEMDFLTSELARAVGLGGRDRRAASASERARLNVTKAIKWALRKIEQNNSSLAQYLAATIRTGTFCRYAPRPQLPTSPELSSR